MRASSRAGYHILVKAFPQPYIHWFVAQADPAASPLSSSFELVSYFIQDEMVLVKSGFSGVHGKTVSLSNQTSQSSEYKTVSTVFQCLISFRRTTQPKCPLIRDRHGQEILHHSHCALVCCYRDLFSYVAWRRRQQHDSRFEYDTEFYRSCRVRESNSTLCKR